MGGLLEQMFTLVSDLYHCPGHSSDLTDILYDSIRFVHVSLPVPVLVLYGGR